MMLSLIVVVCLVAIVLSGHVQQHNMSNSSNSISKALKKGG